MMYNRSLGFLLSLVGLIVILCGVPVIHASGQSSADYSIPSDVLSGGGGTSSSTDYTISYSIGQPSVIGPSAATDYDVHAGFWARIPSELCIHHGDVTADGSVTAGDAQMAFNIVLELYIPTYLEECAADCNGDGSITAGDAQDIFGVIFGGSCVDPLTKQRDFQLKPQNLRTANEIAEVFSSDMIWIETDTGKTSDLTAAVVMTNDKQPVDAFTITVKFDARALTFDGCDMGELFSDWIEFDCKQVAPGLIRIAGFTLESDIPAGSYGNLVVLKFNSTGLGTAQPDITITQVFDDLKGFIID